MKKQVSKTTPEPEASIAIEPTAQVAETAAPKPKVRKKKIEAVTDAVEVEQTKVAAIEIKPIEVEPAEAAAGRAPAKGAGKKAAKAGKVRPEKVMSGKAGSGKAGFDKAAPGKGAPDSANSAFRQGVAAQLDAVKKIKKAKGRDLVTDEPGAEEVADVLGILDDGAEEGTGEIMPKMETAAKDAEGVGPDGKAPDAKLERLQKILAKAGISSRRKAEELILGGRVQINGKVILELGTKADMARDHVRVDGKLLQGAERIRYFVLNKPKGYVTTVSDPEGRPTVMQFFSNERERLYPVGRLDYLSEGLLLVTNDGELANKLTKAASGVEKTYLVKVAGQPTEDMLDVLRQGVVIERGRPGTNSGRVRTAPAKIRQVRQGDNPWYEVVVIEGRNRELRKMFEEIGHHVEKIRRIGYGPLVLDQEPGKLRELEAEEVHSLRLAADGKLKPSRRKGPANAQLPTVAGKTVRYKKADGKAAYEPRREKAVRPEFQQESKSETYPSTRAIVRSSSRPAAPLKSSGPSRSEPRGEFRAETARPAGRPGAKAEFKSSAKPAFKSGGRPEFSKSGFAKPGFAKSGFAKSGPAKPGFAKPGSAKPGFAGKARRPEPPVTEIVLPPRKALPPEPEGGFDDRPSKAEFNPDYKPGFRTGGKPPAFRSEGRPAGKAPFRKDGPPKRFGGDRAEGRPSSRGQGSRPQARFDESGASTAAPFSASADKPKFDRTAGREDYPDSSPEKRVKLGIEPIVERPREQRPRSGGFDRAGAGKSFRPRAGADAPSSGEDREFRRPSGDRAQGRPGTGRPAGGPSEFRPRPAGARPGGFAKTGPSRPFANRPGESRTGSKGRSEAGSKGRSETSSEGRSEFGSRPRPGSRVDGAPAGRSKPFAGDRERPREFKPGAPKKFGAKPAAGGKPGPDGEPRKKERWRNSFTGKNKGRPKPKG